MYVYVTDNTYNHVLPPETTSQPPCFYPSPKTEGGFSHCCNWKSLHAAPVKPRLKIKFQKERKNGFNIFKCFINAFLVFKTIIIIIIIGKKEINVHHRMSIRTTASSKKKGSCLLILSLHTRQHITHLWGHSAGQSWPWQRQTHTERGWRSRVKGRLNIGLAAMNELRCLLMPRANGDQYLYAMQEVHAHSAC